MISHESTLAEAAKGALLSFDATLRRDLSVAPTIDLLCCRAGRLRANTRSIADEDAYFGRLRAECSQGSLDLFRRLPDPAWMAPGDAARD